MHILFKRAFPTICHEYFLGVFQKLSVKLILRTYMTRYFKLDLALKKIERAKLLPPVFLEYISAGNI